MKMIKKMATLMLTVCLAVSCFSMLAYAADGRVMFTDPSTKAGETFEVKGVVERTAGAGFGKVEITMSYDTTMLKFVSGNGTTQAQAGTITYVGDASSEASNRHEFVMKFQALKQGITKIEITGVSIKSVSGATLSYTEGFSAITIAEGTQPVDTPIDVTPQEGATVEVNGDSYVIANAIPENEIPNGYAKKTLEYDMAEYPVVYNEDTGLTLAYLVSADHAGKFFMYVEEDATFAPFEQVDISDSVSIVLLSDVSDVVMPAEYEETTIVLNGQEFPAWKQEDEMNFCIVYAMNNKGETSLYQLDNEESTYQRFTAPEIEEEKTIHPFISALSDSLESHLDYVILGTGLGFLLFVIIIVILGVKLHNRNAELDEIYDEYGLDDEDEKTEDDIMLVVNDEEDEYEYEEDDEEEEESEPEDEPSEAELLIQEGMKEVFAEEAEVKSQAEDADYYDEEDGAEEIFGEFSMDFIDLDD